MSESVDRWADLKAFIAEWYRPLEPRDGISEAIIVRTEKRLGFRLPEVLREFYQIAGMYLRCGDLWDHLSGLDVVDMPEPMLFIYQDEGGQDSYGVPLQRIGETDPQVFMMYCAEEGRSVGKVSEWAFYRIVKDTCYMRAAYNNSAHSMYCPSRVHLTGARLLYSLGEYDDEFWAGDGVLVWTRDCQRWIQLLAKTQEAGEAFVCANRADLIWKEMPACADSAAVSG